MRCEETGMDATGATTRELTRAERATLARALSAVGWRAWPAEMLCLGAGRLRVDLLPGERRAYLCADEETVILARRAAHAVAVRPVGELLGKTVLNLGDLLVEYLDAGIRDYVIDLRDTPQPGAAVRGLMESFERTLARDFDAWSLDVRGATRTAPGVTVRNRHP